jgi:ribosome-binding factor A
VAGCKVSSIYEPRKPLPRAIPPKIVPLHIEIHTDKMESTRQKKIARLLQKELSEIFRVKSNELAPGKMITVTIVRVSPDVSVARVYLSIFPSNENEKVFASIKDNISTIRYDLGKQVHNQLRIVPELAIFPDDSLDYIDNIDKLLNT